MNLNQLPINDLMQMPDHLFGARWFIGCRFDLNETEAVFAISEESLPERTVIWGVLITSDALTFTDLASFGLRLGDQVPATDAAFLECEQIFRGISSLNDLWDFRFGQGNALFLPVQRKILQPTGRRLVVRGIAGTGKTGDTVVALLVSSVPTLIPDFLMPPKPRI